MRDLGLCCLSHLPFGGVEEQNFRSIVRSLDLLSVWSCRQSDDEFRAGGFLSDQREPAPHVSLADFIRQNAPAIIKEWIIFLLQPDPGDEACWGKSGDVIAIQKAPWEMLDA